MRKLSLVLLAGFPLSTILWAGERDQRSARPTVFYYSQSQDGVLRFTDEPPLEDPAPRATRSTGRRPKAFKAVRRLNNADVPTKVYVRVDAEVYVPQSEIAVTYRPAAPTPRRVLRSHYLDLIREAAQHHRVDAALIAAIVQTESAANPNAVSHKGARGLMQLMPATAADLGVRDIHDPRQNVYAGTRYIKQLLKRYRGDLDLALAAYNAGLAAVDRYKGIPPYRETIDYVARVRKYYEQFGHL